MEPEQYQEYIELHEQELNGQELEPELEKLDIQDTQYQPEFDIDISGVASNSERSDIDVLTANFANMKYEFSEPFKTSMRTGLLYSKDYVHRILAEGLPDVRCRCNRIINHNLWQRIFQELYNNYEYFSQNPSTFERMMSQLGVPDRVCCRITYTSAQVPEEPLPKVAGVLTSRKVPRRINLTELGHTEPELKRIQDIRRGL